MVGAHWHGVQVRNIELRRAVFAALLRADRAMTLDELMIQLVEREGIDVAGHLAVSSRQRVSDLLRWQIECGRVVRVAPGVYRVVPEALSRTTRWRCLNWRILRDRAVTVGDGDVR